MTLHHEIFRDFVDDLSNYEPTGQDFKFAARLKHKMMKPHKTEKKRCNWFRKVWEAYCSRLDAAVINDCPTDGHLREGNSYLMITEGKKEIEGNKEDPLLQAGMYYLKVLGEQPENATDKFPCLIIYYMGSTLGFAGAIWGDIPQIAALTPIYTFHAELYSSDMALQVARALGATKKALNKLRVHYGTSPEVLVPESLDWSDPESDEEEAELLEDPDADYKLLSSNPKPKSSFEPANPKDQYLQNYEPSPIASNPSPSNPLQPFPYLFPDKTHFVGSGGNTIQFVYHQRLFPDKLLFHVKATESLYLVVKFTTRYSEAAHRHCAEHGIAPRLYAVEKLKAGWIMVVMEYLNFDEYDYPGSKTPEAELSVTRALETLHNGGYVHGDFRNVNVLIKKLANDQFDVKILDFDWSGKEGDARYPIDINFHNIYRPPTVQLGGEIKQRHDQKMAENIFRPTK